MMKKQPHNLSASFAKNLRATALAAITSALVFLLVRIVFRDSLYSLPLLALATLPFSIGVTNALWRASTAVTLALAFSLLEFTVNAAATPFTLGFALYGACILTALSLLSGGLYWRIRRERDAFNEQSMRERSISALSTELLTAATQEELHMLTLRSLYSVTGCSAVLFVPDSEAGFRRTGSYPDGLLLYPVGDVVRTCLETCRRAGYGTGHFGKSALCCFPVHADGKVLAAAGILINAERGISAYHLHTVELLLVRVGVALSHLTLMRSEQEALMEKELERIRSDFLRSISHDFRTPLTGIIGACSALNQVDVSLPEDTRRELIESVSEEAAWLLRMVENLLSVTRVGTSGPKLNKSCEPIEEVLSETLEKARKRFPHARITAVQPTEFLMVPMDPTLIMQVLMNLIENAVKYSGSTGQIDLTVSDGPSEVSFTVRDYGHGLNKEAMATLFEPSARRAGDSTHGMGLGLSICRSIIHAHGGEITGRNVAPCGAAFTVTLPKEEPNEQC